MSYVSELRGNIKNDLAALTGLIAPRIYRTEGQA